MSEFIRPNAKGARWSIPRDQPYFLCRITPGRDWWDLDDALGAVPGRRAVNAGSQHRWHAIPQTRLSSLQVIASGAPGRLVAHPAA